MHHVPRRRDQHMEKGSRPLGQQRSSGGNRVLVDSVDVRRYGILERQSNHQFVAGTPTQPAYRRDRRGTPPRDHPNPAITDPPKSRPREGGLPSPPPPL